MAVNKVTSTAGGTFTYAILSGTAQEVIDQMAIDKQNMPSYKPISMAYNGTNLSVLVQYST